MKLFAVMLRHAKLRTGRRCMSTYIIFTRRLQPDYCTSTSVGSVFRESTGASFGTTICRSWNMRRCVASRAVCRYLHLCDLPRCRGNHRRIHCPNQTSGAVASVFPQSPSLPVQPNITMLQRYTRIIVTS